MLAWLSRQPGPDPGQDLVLDVGEDGKALAEAGSDGAIRLWDLQSPFSDSNVYRGLSGPITSLCLSTRFGAIASVNKSGQIAIWRITAPQVPQFVGALAHALDGARPLGTVVPTSLATTNSDDTQPPRMTFISSARWLCLDYKYLLDLGSSDPVAWRLPEGAHEVGQVARCCIMHNAALSRSI
jgi:WD40 repeat protein